MHKFSLLILALVAGHASADSLAKVTASNVMLAEPKIDARALHECQPLKGDRVAVQEIWRNFEGMAGLNIARIRVVDGMCAGKTGWIGVDRLESAR